MSLIPYASRPYSSPVTSQSTSIVHSGSASLTSLDEKIALTGTYTTGLYTLTGRDEATGDSVFANLTIDSNDDVATVENYSGGLEFEFIKDNDDALKLRNRTASANTVKYDVIKLS